jgi:Cu(I)/Ag(I) efflux system membrane fusion protein
MKNKTAWLVWAVLPSLLFAGGCRGKSVPEPGLKAGEHEPETAIKTSVTLTAEAVATAKLKAEPAARRKLARRVEAVGELEFNARRLVHLTARTAGRVERLLAVQGDRVREGQVLAEIYSLDYLALQAEFLQAAERVRRLSGDAAEEAAARAFLESVRQRLLVIGATAEEIGSLSSPAAIRPLLQVRASLSGTVLESGVLTGDHLELGTSLFRLADLSTLWACIRVFEKDLAAVKIGGEVRLRTQAYPGEIFSGRLVLVGDIVDSKTRTVEGRVEVPNRGGRLKAGMYVEASLAEAGERTALVVPESSLQDFSGQASVFVQTAAGTFVRRDVQTGERWPGWVEIVSGVAEGELVVTAGSFLLKSEMMKSRLGDEHGHD